MSWLKSLLQHDTRTRVLAITANDSDHIALQGIAARARWDLKFAPGPEGAAETLKHLPAAVVLCDRDLPGLDWRDALRRVRETSPSSAIVVIAPHTDDHFWLEVIERGGFGVVTRPFHENRLIVTVRQAALQPTK